VSDLRYDEAELLDPEEYPPPVELLLELPLEAMMLLISNSIT